MKRGLGKQAFSFNKLNIEKWLLTTAKLNLMPDAHIVDRYMQTVRSFGVRNDGKGGANERFVRKWTSAVATCVFRQRTTGLVSTISPIDEKRTIKNFISSFQEFRSKQIHPELRHLPLTYASIFTLKIKICIASMLKIIQILAERFPCIVNSNKRNDHKDNRSEPAAGNIIIGDATQSLEQGKDKDREHPTHHVWNRSGGSSSQIGPKLLCSQGNEDGPKARSKAQPC